MTMHTNAPAHSSIVRSFNVDTGRYENRITFGGQTKTTQEWADHLGITPRALLGRLRNGWSLSKALTATSERQRSAGREAKLLTFNGESKSLKDWASSIGISASTLTRRLQVGWTIEEALTRPKGRQGVRATGGGQQLPSAHRGPAGGVTRTICLGGNSHDHA